MTTLKIEKGVPVPPVKARVGNNEKLLLAMEPGDSVFFDTPIAKKAVRLYRVARRMGITIVLRKDAHGTRVWRMADAPKAAAKAAQRPATAPTRRAGGKKHPSAKRRSSESLVIERIPAQGRGSSVRI